MDKTWKIYIPFNKKESFTLICEFTRLNDNFVSFSTSSLPFNFEITLKENNGVNKENLKQKVNEYLKVRGSKEMKRIIDAYNKLTNDIKDVESSLNLDSYQVEEIMDAINNYHKIVVKELTYNKSKKDKITTQCRLIDIDAEPKDKIVRFNLLTKKEKDTFINIKLSSPKSNDYLERILFHICHLGNIDNSGGVTNMILNINKYLKKKELWLDIDFVEKNGKLEKYFMLDKINNECED